jgi:phage gp29-like protein
MANQRSGEALERAPTRKEESTLTALLVGAPSLAEQFTRIGGNLTPQRVSTILAMADMGRPAHFVDLFHELRQRDAHLQSVMQAREICVASLPAEVAPPGENPKKRDKKIARQCTLALRSCDSLPNAIAHWVGEGNVFGHATSELVWKRETEGELAGLMVPDFFENLSCRRFGFRQADGALLFDPTSSGSVEAAGVDLLTDFPLGKYIQYRPRVNGDVLTREGLGRCLVWMALFRNFDLRDWLALAEMAWKPKRTAKYKKADYATEKDRRQLLTLLERLTTNGVAIYPDTVELELHWPSNFSNQSSHKELADYLAREISKATLGTSDVSEQNGKNGARAAVETRNELRKELKVWDAAGTAKLIQRYVVRPFYRMNYGERIEAGTYVPMLEEPENRETFAKAMADLRVAGLRIPAAWVRHKIGAPEPRPGEELLGDGAPDPKDPNGKPTPATDDDGENSEESSDKAA